MEIQFLKKLEKNRTIGDWTIRGFDIQSIESLELSYNEGKEFPKSFREFLFLAGEFSGLALDRGNGYEWMQEKAKEVLEDAGEEIKRPFFVTDQLDGCEQFGIIYLDEVEDDPIAYNCNPYFKEDGEEFITPIPQKKFSALIDAYVEKAIIDEKYGGYSEE